VALRQQAEVISPPAAEIAGPVTAAEEPQRRTRTIERNRSSGGPVSAPARTLAAVGRRLKWLRRLASIGAILVLWHLGSTQGWIEPQKFPSPGDVWRAFTDLLEGGELASHLLASLGRIGKGLVLGGTIGILVGTIAGLSRVGEEVVDAPIQALRVVPSLALTSLFIIWFGIGETSKVGLIALGAFFPLYLNTFGGIRNVDLRLVEGARIFGLGRFALATKVMLPGALPQVLIGLRQSIGVAWLTLVVVEQTNAPNGVGSLIIDAREFMRTDIVVVGLLLYACLGLLTDVLVRALEKRTLAWRGSYEGR
jgi:sulfonate transport system permease protein